MLLLYLDASTAGLLLQGILGGIAGALVMLSIFWQRLKSVLDRTRRIIGRKTYEPESRDC